MGTDHSSFSGADKAILRIVQEDSTTKLDTIAESVGASGATVQRRLRNFREAGIIQGEVALVDPKLVGQEMTFLILVEMERERIDILDTFRRKIHSEPQVQQCYYITGEADFALIAMAKNMEQYQELIQRLFFNDTNVKRFRTSVVMDRTKVSLQVPL